MPKLTLHHPIIVEIILNDKNPISIIMQLLIKEDKRISIIKERIFNIMLILLIKN